MTEEYGGSTQVHMVIYSFEVTILETFVGGSHWRDDIKGRCPAYLLFSSIPM